MTTHIQQPLTPEILVSRLGDYLVERQLISAEDLQRALAYQAQLREQGETVRLGKILTELGLIEQTVLDHAITEQILQLRTALQDANQQLERRVEQRTAELREALRKLSEMSEMKSNFVSNISHELRTPLTHIKGYLDLLSSGDLGGLNADQAHALSVMTRSSERLENLIEDLIRFSLMERGELTLKIQPVDLIQVAKTVVERAQPKAQAQNIHLDLQFPPKLTKVDIDEEKISWVVLQLIDNAIKFTPPGGSVQLILQDDDEYIRVTVSDTGIGIPPAELEHIFEAFRQVDGSSTRRYGGTGLGLALVHKIIEAHDTTIEVHSQPQRGSQFEFRLKKSLDG